MKTLTFKISGHPLWICDMRPGVSQDGVNVTLAAGEYRCTVTRSGAEGLRTISYVRAGARPTSESRVGEVSLDMARVGVLELIPLLARYAGDWDALAEWSEEVTDRHQTTWGGRLLSSGHHAAFFDIGSDCTLEVFKLRDGRRHVGIELRQLPRKAVKAKPQRWTWVDVKWRGIGDPWSTCNDWAYPPDAEMVFADIDFELSYFADAKIDYRRPLADYCPKFNRIEWIKVYIENSGAPRQSITRKVRIPKLKAPITAHALAAGIVKIFEEARRIA